MNILSRLRLSFALIGLAITMPVIANTITEAAAQTTVSSKDKQKMSLLFVLRADTGVIAKTDGGLTLTLQGMDNKVLYFSDRPVRRAGFITMDSFMSDWTKGSNSFQANPPNAAIVHVALKTNDRGIAQAIPVELTNPTATESGWMFHVSDLKGTLSIGTYNGVSMFVDDIVQCNSLRTCAQQEGKFNP